MAFTIAPMCAENGIFDGADLLAKPEHVTWLWLVCCAWEYFCIFCLASWVFLVITPMQWQVNSQTLEICHNFPYMHLVALSLFFLCLLWYRALPHTHMLSWALFMGSYKFPSLWIGACPVTRKQLACCCRHLLDLVKCIWCQALMGRGKEWLSGICT